MSSNGKDDDNNVGDDDFNNYEYDADDDHDDEEDGVDEEDHEDDNVEEDDEEDDSYDYDDDEGKLSRVGRNDPSATEIDLDMSDFSFEVVNVGEVADALRDNTHVTHTCLDYNRSHTLYIGCAESLAETLRVNHTLTSLEINGCEIGDAEAETIAAGLKANDTLTNLGLCGCRIKDGGATAIAAALSERNETGRRTAISSLTLDCSNMSVVGLRALADMLRTNRTIRELSLTMDHETAEATKIISDSLIINKTIKSLKLETNEINDDGAKTIAAAIVKNHTIKRLNLENSEIDDDGAKTIAAAIVKNFTIEILNLCCNRIGDDGAKAIAAALFKTHNITRLDLGFNYIGDIGAKALACSNLLRLHHCDIDIRCNKVRGGARYFSFIRFLELHENEDIHDDAMHEAVSLLEYLLPSIDFNSLPSNKAKIAAAPCPIPNRLVLLDKAHRFIVKCVLNMTRNINYKAMPLALQKVGEGKGTGSIHGNNDDNGIGLGVIFELCRKNIDLLLHTKTEEGSLGGGQGQEVRKGHASIKSNRVAANGLDTNDVSRKRNRDAITVYFQEGKRVCLEHAELLVYFARKNIGQGDTSGKSDRVPFPAHGWETRDVSCKRKNEAITSSFQEGKKI